MRYKNCLLYTSSYNYCDQHTHHTTLYKISYVNVTTNTLILNILLFIKYLLNLTTIFDRRKQIWITLYYSVIWHSLLVAPHYLLIQYLLCCLYSSTAGKQCVKCTYQALLGCNSFHSSQNS